MIHKIVKMLMSVVMLVAMTGVYASNTGVIKVTNNCKDELLVTVIGVDAPSCVSAYVKRVLLGQTVAFATASHYNYTVASGDYVMSVSAKVDFYSTKTSYAELVLDKKGQNGCTLYINKLK